MSNQKTRDTAIYRAIDLAMSIILLIFLILLILFLILLGLLEKLNLINYHSHSTILHDKVYPRIIRTCISQPSLFWPRSTHRRQRDASLINTMLQHELQARSAVKVHWPSAPDNKNKNKNKRIFLFRVATPKTVASKKTRKQKIGTDQLELFFSPRLGIRSRLLVDAVGVYSHSESFPDKITRCARAGQ